MIKLGSTGVRPSSALTWVPWLVGAATLAPLAIFHARFAELFWFGDEWDMLEQLTQQGAAAWSWKIFGDVFFPIFKLSWSSLLFAGGGSYLVMISALWVTHAVNVALLGRLLRQEGFGWIGAIFVMLVFGFTSANLETVGWAVQWGAILAMTFFLGAALWLGGRQEPSGGGVYLGILLALVTASALSFSRGILTGGVLAVASLWPVPERTCPVGWAARWGRALLCLLPAAVVAATIARYAPGNQTHLFDHNGTLRHAAQFGLWYFSVNPAYRLLGCSSWAPSTALLLGAPKAALIGWGLWHSQGRGRRLLTVLLLFDVGNAVLLGVGRYDTGLSMVTSSRYQYVSLICTLPFVGCLLEALPGQPSFAAPRLALAATAIVAATWLSARSWSVDLAGWSDARGRATRELLFVNPRPPAQGAVPGIPYFSTARAQELARQYHLH